MNTVDSQNLEDIKNYTVVSGFRNYIIYNDGRVYSKTFNKFLKVRWDRHYLYYNILNKNGLKKIAAHKLVAQNFLPNPDNKNLVIHIDGNKRNNHVSNLRWADRSERKKPSRDTAKTRRGENNPLAKLTNLDVKNIRNLSGPINKKHLSVYYNVSTTTIRNILNGKVYKI